MYRLRKKFRAGKKQPLPPDDCFATETKYWFWVSAVLVTGAVIYAITTSYSQRTVYSSIATSFPRGGQLQTIASTKCPYCSVGILDARGRCNAIRCPIYSPNWGNNLQVGNVAVTKCPRCAKGILDAQGRCNQKGCPLYSPDWGKTITNPKRIPVKQILIKELALIVAASEGKGTVVVQSVYINGNAEKAGLKADDRITRFNGRKVKSVKQFQSVVALASPETNVKVEIIRNGKKVKSIIMVGEGEMEGAIPPPTRIP
jgi:hypothetical protein